MFWWTRSSSTGEGEQDGGDKGMDIAEGEEKTATDGVGCGSDEGDGGSDEGDGGVVCKPPTEAANDEDDVVTKGLDGSGSGEERVRSHDDDDDGDDGDDKHDGDSCRDPGEDPPLDIATVTTEQMHRALERNRNHISWENIVLSAQKSGTLHVSHCMADFLREDEEDGGGEESPSTRAALYLLGVSNELRQLRFRLVPSKMKEPVFWAGVFTILGLRDEGPASAARKRSAVPPSSGLTPPTPPPPQDKQQPPSPRSAGIVAHRSSSTPYPTGSEVASVDQLHALLRQKDAQISELLRRNEELKRASASGSDATAEAPPGAPCTKCGSIPSERNGKESHHHSGKWIMNGDSIDFLNMDEQLKSNLRKEKQKRLDEVRDQMRFILDTDDVASTLGQWDCCKAMDYSAKGCAATK